MADRGTDASAVMDQEPVHDELAQLFDVWDVDNSGHLEFQEVRTKLEQLAPEQDAASTRNAAFEALLLADRDGNRKLSRDEFRHLMRRIAEAAELPLANAVQRLLSQEAGPAEQPSPSSNAPPHKHLRFAAELTSAPQDASASGAFAAGEQDPKFERQHDRQQQHRMHKPQEDIRPKVVELFELFDRNGDGTVSFAELCSGLEKFMPQGSVHNKKSITTMITEATQVLLAHDVDKDQRLNLSEFEAFIEAFMRAAGGYTLAEVVDHLLTLQRSKGDNVCLQKALDASEDQIQQQLTGASSDAANMAQDS